MCTGQPCVVAQPHCGGIMGVRMGVMLGGVGCMMWEPKITTTCMQVSSAYIVLILRNSLYCGNFVQHQQSSIL